jgi:hypothetical protein
MHFDLDKAVSLAGLTPASLDIETETAGLIASDPGFGKACEEIPDM